MLAKNGSHSGPTFGAATMRSLRAYLIAATTALSFLAPVVVTPALAQGMQSVRVQDGIPTGPTISGTTDQTKGLYFGTNRVGISGHLEGGLATAVQPVLSGCGTTPTLAAGSTDLSGTVTMGTAATGCVITFGTAFTAAPSCTVTWRATPLASQSYTVSASAITTTQTSTSNNLLDYTCIGKSGG
jgi:hypothetical protein